MWWAEQAPYPFLRVTSDISGNAPKRAFLLTHQAQLIENGVCGGNRTHIDLFECRSFTDYYPIHQASHTFVDCANLIHYIANELDGLSK